MLAAPVTLEAAVRQHWYQLPLEELFAHGVASRTEANWDDINRRLAAHVVAIRPALLRQLDARFARLASLDGFGAPPSYCGWLRERQPPSLLTNLQQELWAQCIRTAAPDAVGRVLARRAAGLHVDLASLRSLDVQFPRAMLGDVHASRWSGLEQAWHQGVRDRLGSARDPVLAAVAAHFRAKPADAPPASPRAECAALVGPEAGTEEPLGIEARHACLAQATSGLLAQQPRAVRAVQAEAAAPAPTSGPIASVQARCQAAVGRAYPALTDDDPAVTGPVWQACEAAAGPALERDLDARLAPAIARVLSAPRTLAGLEATGWFELPAAVLAEAAEGATPYPAVPADDPSRRLRARFEQAVGAARQEATGRAVAQVGQAYAAASDNAGSALAAARALCGPYLGSAEANRAVPISTSEARRAVQQACRSEEAEAPGRGCKAALLRFGADNPFARERLWVAAPDGQRVPVEAAPLVCAAGMDGFQVSTRGTGWLGRGHELRITPVGRDAPALAAPLEQVRRADGVLVWHVGALTGLPGLDGPLATVACLSAPASQAANVTLWGVLGGALLHLGGQPEGGNGLIGNALGQHAAATACAAAKAAFLRQADGR